jgi:hypothetical protein
MGFANILSFQDYDRLGAATTDMFYQRANFDVKSQKLTPPFYQWKKTCLCHKPANPDLQ